MQQTAVNASIEQGIPPSFDGSHVFYMMALFGLMTMVLLAMNWLWRRIWLMVEDPQPLCSPATVSRVVVILLLMTALIRGIPATVLLLKWPELGAAARLDLSQVERFLDGVALIPFGLAWVIDYLAGGVVQFQLKRRPPPGADLWPRREDLLGPVKIAAGSLAIAFAVVFLQ
jgi:hypothetical protein